MAGTGSVLGREASFADLQATMLGRVLATMRGLSVKEKSDRKMVRAVGRKAIAYADGSTSYEGSVKLLLSEFFTLARSANAKGRSVTRIAPFDIVGMWIPDDDPVLGKITVKGVLLQEYELKHDVGDMEMEIELKFEAADLVLK
jgi:hypothetical protein